MVRRGQDAPAHLAGVPRVRVDDAVAQQPRAVAELLHRCWVARQPVVVELAADNATLRAPETTDEPPHALPSWFTFDRERLHILMWTNNVDVRGDTPTWWHGVKAQRLSGAGAVASDIADVEVGGVPAWVDGGPRGPLPVPHVHAETVDVQRAREQPRLVVVPPSNEAVTGDLAELAPDQLAAVLHASGPARIIAPAGSGKTRVLTSRLRHLLARRDVEPGLVTALAYNTPRSGRDARPHVRGASLDPHAAQLRVVGRAPGRGPRGRRRAPRA